MSSNWTIDDSRDLFNLERWGLGFFDINESGEIVAELDEQGGSAVSVLEAIKFANNSGYQAPFVVRFPDLIRRRIGQINAAFDLAIDQFEYHGNYRCIYPAKVNQHHDVIATAIEASRQHGGGVEAGSKAELVALLLMVDNEMPILCNGFKDRSIVEVALRGIQLGRNVTIVIEKPGDLQLVAEMAQQLQCKPRLGIRVKLAAQSGGRWNASGGSKSKFGLTVTQVLEVVSELRNLNMLDCLQLLHFHPGSQISNIRKIKNSIVEAARIYADLKNNGVPLETIDVGGGLAIDYTGERNQDPSSKNYSLQEYANDVVYYIQQVCLEANVTQPNIVSESGRAITAHHSMLVVPVLAHPTQDKLADNKNERIKSAGDESNIIRELQLILEALHPGNLSEYFHDAQATIETAWQMFAIGALTLEQRSSAEELFDLICQNVAKMVEDLEFVPRELEELRHQLAETYIANFSLFQGIPDAWAISQVFPVAPIHRLNERPTRRAVIGDITCDSDGKIDCFIGSKGGRNSLPVHQLTDEPYYIGVFLIGAYQEALSDDHNLMGNFHVLSIANDGDVTIRAGASTLDVLEHVYHESRELNESLHETIGLALDESRIDLKQSTEIRRCFETVMQSYTYLDVESSPQRNVSPAPHIRTKTNKSKPVTEKQIRE